MIRACPLGRLRIRLSSSPRSQQPSRALERTRRAMLSLTSTLSALALALAALGAAPSARAMGTDNNLTSLAGTWSSGSGAVVTGPVSVFSIGARTRRRACGTRTARRAGLGSWAGRAIERCWLERGPGALGRAGRSRDALGRGSASTCEPRRARRALRRRPRCWTRVAQERLFAAVAGRPGARARSSATLSNCTSTLGAHPADPAALPPSPLARALLDHHPSRSTSSTSHSQGFADPMNNNRPFIYPSNTGIAYSFTDDGYFETAWYRFQANGACSRSSFFGSCPSLTEGRGLMHDALAARSLQAGVPDGDALLAARHRASLLPLLLLPPLLPD